MAAPSLNLDGGRVNLEAQTGTIYYTLDGSDPRAPGGAVSATAKEYRAPVAITPDARVTARALSGKRWSAPARRG